MCPQLLAACVVLEVQSSLQVLFWSLGLLGVIQCIAGRTEIPTLTGCQSAPSKPHSAACCV